MSSSWSFDWSSPCPMEVNPVDTACTISNEDDSLSGHELHPNSVDLQPAGKIDMDGEASARQELDRRECRSSDRAAGPGQVAPALRSEVASGIQPGDAAAVGDLAGPEPEQVQAAEAGAEPPETKLGPEVNQALRQRAESIILAGGLMLLIANEPAVAEVVHNELLLLTFQLVQTLNAPVGALWAKRAFKPKMLAMLLASAIAFGEIELEYAESEGKRLTEQAKTVQATVKCMEKAARAKAAKAAMEPSTTQERGEQDSLQCYLAQVVPSAFKASCGILKDAPPKLLQLTDSELMPPPPPPPSPPPPPPPPPAPRPPPVLGLSEEEEDVRWMQYYEECLNHKQAELQFKELELELRERRLSCDWRADLMRSSKRQVREQMMLEREISSLETEIEEIDSGSSCKRLRAQRDSMGKELSRVEHYAQHFARAADRLRTERDEALAQLATAHTDIDDLLEFKASTCLEAQRLLMCPRVSE